MRNWSDQIIQRTKNFFRDKYGKELTTEEAIECMENVSNLADLLRDWDRSKRIKGEDNVQRQGHDMGRDRSGR
jgi:hypothetical protein